MYPKSRRYSASKGRFGRNRGNRRSPNARRGPAKQFIDSSKFIKTAVITESAPFIPKNQFNDFEISGIIKKNIAEKGFVSPLPIQDEAIPIALLGKDVLGIANTGTGKTAAFAIPILNRLLNNPQSKVLVIAPTRELAQQIENEFRAFSKNTNLFCTLLIGGAPMPLQIRNLHKEPRIIIGTPGRIKDHLSRRTVNFSKFDHIVLDEVDRMLDMGFINDIRLILGHLQSNRQSLFFTATLDPKIEQLIYSFMDNPVKISVKTSESSDNVHQDVMNYSSTEDKIEKLHTILIHSETYKALIFDETKRNVEKLSKELNSRGFKVDSIHGGKTQGQRQRALSRFKTNEVTVLVATDVAARGLDISDISHVINYTTPQTYDDYIHRIGRAGRAGKTGVAYTFIKK